MSGKRAKAHRSAGASAAAVDWAALPPEVRAAREPGTDQLHLTRAVYGAMLLHYVDGEVAAGRGGRALELYQHLLRACPTYLDQLYDDYCADLARTQNDPQQ